MSGTSFALAATQGTPVAQTSSPPPANFGAPPSGEIPILYNDRHVYARPDILKQGRVLAALVRGGTILIPLRSMFEQMGATVSYDSASQTATVSKAGAEVKVTVGKPEVIINGESRPLDVPPVLYSGDVLVPVRVISEGMGAYVQWVPDRRLVVVRYIPATPPPTEAPAPPPPPSTEAPAPPPATPNPLKLGGYFRSYYFTRQNASNNPGAQFNFTPGAKYSSTGVNQASWNSAISVHGEYDFPSGWDVGGSYLYANPMDGPCVVPANHAKGAVCVTQVPPSTNPDDTLPGFTMSTFYQAYLGFKGYGFDGQLGNILFTSPWANPSDSRLKPVAFQGGYLNYTAPSYWTVEAADMLSFEGRTSSAFSQNTLLTSYPAGSPGLPSNIFLNNGNGVTSDGFTMGKAGYDNPVSGISVNGYFYGVYDIANMWWGDGQYTFTQSSFKPFIALQGGTESNAGLSYIGKIDSQVFGAEIGANVTKNIQLTAGYDEIPWHTDSVFLPKNVTCNNSDYQISTKGATLAYLLPMNAAQCFTNASTGLTQINYGGWASPYTDSYATDPLFTTQISQGMVDRRAPGNSWKVALNFVSSNKKWVFIASDAWYNYGNGLAPQNTNEWNLDGQYHFSSVGKGPYRGLLLRYRYAERTLSNTFCGASDTSCAPGASFGSSYLGGLPLFKYNRAQLEYDF